MNCGDAVGAVRANDSQVGHSDMFLWTFFHEAHPLDAAFVTRISRTHFIKQASIDLEDNFQMTRQDRLKPCERPFLESFGEQCVVGVRQSPLCELPSLVPAEMRFIEQNPHQLRNCHRWMCIVELDGDFIWKRTPVKIVCSETSHEIRERTGDEKVLLYKTQSLSHARVVIGIQHAGQRFRLECLSQRANKIAAAELLKVEKILRRRSPEPQRINGLATIPNDWAIKRNTD